MLPGRHSRSRHRFDPLGGSGCPSQPDIDVNESPGIFNFNEQIILDKIAMKRKITEAFITTSLLFLLSGAALSAGKTLPQLKLDVTITGNNHQQLKDYFEPMEEAPGGLSDKIGTLLIKLLPKAYSSGCREMVSAWGKKAKAKTDNVVRVLYINKRIKKLQQVLLAYTCFSAAEGYGDKYYDERLALLSVDSSFSRLTMMPHASPCDTCTGLTHLGFREELNIGGIPAVSVIVATYGENPCCKGTPLKEDFTVRYYILEPGGMKQVLSLQKHRLETYGLPSGDSTALYDAEIELNKDSDGSIKKIVSSFEIKINGSSVRHSFLAYVWNRKMRGFQEGIL